MTTAKAKSKTKAKQKSAGKAAPASHKPNKDPIWLRDREDRREERRFLPKAAAAGLAGVLLTSLGALALGAGFFGQFLRTAGPHPYGVHLLVLGVVIFGLGLLAGSRGAPVLRVGDAGLAVERGEKVVERLGWHEVDAVRYASGVVTFSGGGKLVPISIAAHPDAAALAVREGRARIPARMADAPDNLPGPEPDAGTRIVLESPQVAGLRCAASNRLISFEADARLCGRCGQAYHKEEIPSRCVTCDARLR